MYPLAAPPRLISPHATTSLPPFNQHKAVAAERPARQAGRQREVAPRGKQSNQPNEVHIGRSGLGVCGEKLFVRLAVEGLCNGDGEPTERC